MAGEGASAAALVFDSERERERSSGGLCHGRSLLSSPAREERSPGIAASSLGQQNQISQTKERGTREAAAEATEAVFMKQAARGERKSRRRRASLS